MKHILAIILLMFALGACATSAPLMAKDFTEPRKSVTVLVMDPDVKMNFLTTSGPELRVDWSETAEANLMTGLERALKSSGDTLLAHTSEKDMSEDAKQVMLLNAAVTETMKYHVGLTGSNVVPVALPHKVDAPFDYSLGQSVQEMSDGYEADYALFMTANSQFQSSGVIFRNLLIAAATGAMSGGAYVSMPANQSYNGVFVTLVDLETGQIVWANGKPNGDPRDPEAAKTIIADIMENSPLAD